MSHVGTWWNIRFITPADNYCYLIIVQRYIFSFFFSYVRTFYSLDTFSCIVHDIEMQCTAMHHYSCCSGSSASELLMLTKVSTCIAMSLCLFCSTLNWKKASPKSELKLRVLFTHRKYLYQLNIFIWVTFSFYFVNFGFFFDNFFF